MQIKICELNNLTNLSLPEFIKSGDKEYYDNIMKIAADVRDNSKERPIILISGPSGSGKTTTAKILEGILDNWGYSTHTLPMDDYFSSLTPEQRKLADEHKLDLESPERVDAEFLNAQLDAISKGIPVRLPKFDFSTNQRHLTDEILERKENELVILEGIHALNPSVVTFDDSHTTRIYISVRTRLSFDDDSLLHPEKIRLMRRMLRDKIYRGRKIDHTLRMFDSVQRGENNFIMPFKHRATHDIDTFIKYEVGVYKDLLFDELKQLPPDEKIKDMIAALTAIEPISLDRVPKESLIREFIGDGQFAY
ncbi:MAG: nucleoside kinase [Clostridia bacterium]|nr:nucleoside kinase [Clostridia bacterium]